jgi:tape measure domain-containing protein
MAAPLEWVFKLTDKMSAPAKQINEALAKTDVVTKAAEKSTKGLDAAQTTAAQSAAQLSAAQNKVADATAKADAAGTGWWARLGPIGKGATVAAAGMVAIGAAAAGAAVSMFEAAAAQDKLNRAFAGSLGGQGRGAQGYLRGIAGATELTRPQLEQLALPLARQGLGAGALERLIPAALDVQADGGSAAQAVEIFSKIASTGKIEGEAFKALNLNAEAALTKIGARVGMSNVADVKKAIEAGQIRSNDILEGLLSSIAGEGMLGDKAVAAAKSPSAALNRFRNIQETVLSQLAESKALPTLTAALDKFTAVLTSDRTVNGVSAFFTRVADAIDKVDWEKAGSAVLGALDAFAKIGEIAIKLGLGAAGTVAQTVGDDKAPWWNPVATFKRDFGLGEFANVAGAPSADDFVMRSDGSVLNINSRDALVGFKPGGPIESMFGSSSGVVIENITISVEGSGTPEDTAARLAASIRPALIAELDRMAIEVG